MPYDGEELALIAGQLITDFILEAGLDRRGSIPDDMTFRGWCEDLGRRGLKVDGKPFNLANRPAMHFVYDAIPTTREQAYGNAVVLMKCAQVGFTVMEMLAAIYLLLKFEPLTIGMFLPDQALAGLKSTERFMPILRLVPDAYSRMVEVDPVTKKKRAGEGNVRSRRIGESLVLFSWTTGKATTESMPMDVISFDEVQEMTLEALEKASERLSASDFRFKVFGSTANWPDSDIHHWYKKGTQHRFRTRCLACEGEQIMDDCFPPPKDGKSCIAYDETARDWRYVCVHCDAPIDPQCGEWRPDNPDAIGSDGKGITSIHFPQFLSPTISAREMIESYQSATNLKNWFNRKAGKPWTDPSQVPVNLEHLNACAAAGIAAGLVWKKSARNTFMGVDNMGGYSCAIIVERLPTGVMALVHAEQVHALDPWARLDELMRAYGVQVCVCEQLPNYDSAKQFAHRHLGRVFLVAAYMKIDDDMLRWGDATQSRADRKTAAEFRDRYNVSLDQFKMMAWALARLTSCTLWTPDPNGLQQEVILKGVPRTVSLLRDVLWDHFTRTALVTEQDDEEHKTTRFVKKIGLDPHFSFSLMLACAAWCRANGTGSFIMPDAPAVSDVAARVEAAMPGLPAEVVKMIGDLPPGVCGSCRSFEAGNCVDRGFRVGERDAACPLYIAAAGS